MTSIGPLQCIDVKGKNVAVIGASNIVGASLYLYCFWKRGERPVSICHIDTGDFREFTRNADIVVAAAGNPNLIKKKDIKKDAIIILDVGINRLETDTK